jgi:gamma-glutamylcyclotransferase (GGCT)/AIG2-like uncharacterized protein YtfP
MPLLFSYGTLQQEDVQRSTFGRLLNGERDQLVGFEPARLKIEDPAIAARMGKTHLDDARYNGNDASRVAGTVFEVTDDELAAADGYEAQYSYRRVSAVLASGRPAWVYVHSADSPDGTA